VTRATQDQTTRDSFVSNTGLLPSMVRLSKRLLLRKNFITLLTGQAGNAGLSIPPYINNGFGLFPVRSPLLGEYLCLLAQAVLFDLFSFGY
jgi:hypothetical protein